MSEVSNKHSHYENSLEEQFVEDIKQIVQQGKHKAYVTINSAMLETYWNIGKRIVEQEQEGKERADYGVYLLKLLSKELTHEFGKGFS